MTDYRRSDVRFSAAGLASLKDVLTPLWGTADRHNALPAAIAIAWVLSNGSDMHVIPGARSVEQLTVALRGAEIVLSGDERMKLEISLHVSRAERLSAPEDHGPIECVPDDDALVVRDDRKPAYDIVVLRRWPAPAFSISYCCSGTILGRRWSLGGDRRC